MGMKFSPPNLHGLSHREIGDHSDAISLLFEAPEPVLDATRGRTTREQLLTGKDITIIYIPLMLGVLLPDVHFDVKHLLLKLILTIVVPLVLGLFIRSRFEKAAHTAEKYLHLISRLFVVLLLLVLIGLYYKQIIGLFGTYAILAGVIYSIVAFGIGYLLGWPERGTMVAMGFMHGGRNARVAVMVANSVFSDQPNVMLMLATLVILVLAMLIPVSLLFKIKPGTVARRN